MMKNLCNTKAWRVCKYFSVLLMLTMSMSAYADDIDFVDLELDQEYSLTGIFSKHYYKYTATASGTLTFIGTDLMYLYDLDSGETSLGTSSYVDGKRKVTYEVEADNTYYFYYKLNSSSTATFTASFVDPDTGIELTYTNPATETTLDIVSGGLISLQFNIEVSLGSATLSSGSQSETVSYNYVNGYYSYSIKDIVYNWLSAESISPGDDVTLTISNVTSVANSNVVYGDDGTLTLTYLAPEMPTTFEKESSTIPAKFLSYWLPDDEDGKMILVFSGNLNEEVTPTVTLRFGSTDEEDAMYTEYPDCTVSGNTVTVDFTDSLRLAEKMLPNASNPTSYTTMSIKVSGIYDVNNVLIVDPDATGSAGSCNISLDYEDISANVTTDFDPSSGKVLATTRTSVELWINGISVVSYSGANLSYTSSNGNVSTTVAKEELEIDDYGDGSATITIPLSSDAVGGINLTVELADVAFTDGLDHSDVSFSASYNEFSMEWVTEAPAEAIETYAENEVFQVSSHVASRIGYMTITFKDETDNEILRSGYMTYNESTGYWEYTNPRELEFTSGHTYSVTATAWNMQSTYSSNSVTYGEISFTFEGAIPAYEYSEYNFVSISPDPDEVTLTSAEENTFTITFSGPVSVDNSYTFINYGQGITYSFSSVTAEDDDDNDGYATTWTLVVPTWYMEELGGNDLNLTIVAVDSEGRRVEGTYGEDDQTYFAFSYANTIGVPDLEFDPADGSTVESLSTITVSYEDGIVPTWLVGEKYIKVYNAAGDEVAYCSEYEEVADPDNYWGPSIAFVITLSEEITTEGTYTLYIPAQFFSLGGGTYTSKETSVTYTIADPDGINRITTGSELNGDIYTISGMKVDNVSKKGIYIIGGKKVVVK